MDFNFDRDYTALEALERIRRQLFVIQQFNITKEQEEYFEFIKCRLNDGEEAENRVLEIQCIVNKY